MYITKGRDTIVTKQELRMTNNELEARLIELEAVHESDQEKLAEVADELRIMTVERDEALDQSDHWQECYDNLAQEIKDEADARPAIPYAEWYRMIHPVTGGNPDLNAIAATEHMRIIA